MKHILFIVNRQSGTDRKKDLYQDIARWLDKEQFTYDIVFTEYHGHATELSKQAAENGTSIIVAAGGDGSVNEVATGILNTETILGIIPKGSGNGLARALNIPRNIRQAIGVINRQEIKRIDIAYANDRLFLSNAGVGFDAYIARRFAKQKRRGLSNYAGLVINSFWKYKPRKYTLLVDGIPYKEKAFFIAVANGNQFGYEFKIAPDARIDDAWLDICIMKPIRIHEIVPVIWQSLSGNYRKSKYVKHLRGKEIIIARKKLKWMQVDGEAVDIREIRKLQVRIEPAALQVIIP